MSVLCGNSPLQIPTDDLEEGNILSSAVERSNAPHIKETAVYGFRWVVLFLFMAVAFLNQLQYTAFTTIVVQTKAFYGISSLEVNMLSAAYPMVFAVLVFPVILFYERRGFRWGMILGAFFNAGCALLKLGSTWYSHYWLLMAAQVFGGLSQVFLLALPPMLASLWFPVSQRTFATATSTLSGFVGAAVSFLYTPMLLSDAENNGDLLERSFMHLWLSQAVPSAVVLAATVVFVRDRPPLPPSVSAASSGHHAPTAALLQSDPLTPAALARMVLKQVRNFSFLRLIVGFGLANGLFAAFITVLPQITTPYGVDSEECGRITSAGILAASCSSLLFARFVDARRTYKSALLGMYAVATVLVSGVVLVVFEVGGHSVGMLVAMYLLLVPALTSALPAIPVTLEFVVEKTYPHPEMVASSLAMLSMSACSVGGSLVLSAILSNTPTTKTAPHALYAVLGALILAVLLISTVREEHNRHTYERLVEGESKRFPLNAPAAGQSMADSSSDCETAGLLLAAST